MSSVPPYGIPMRPGPVATWNAVIRILTGMSTSSLDAAITAVPCDIHPSSLVTAIPVWKFPGIARGMTRRKGLDPERALRILLTSHVRVHGADGVVTCIVPRTLMAQTATSPAAYVQMFVDMHREGTLRWDAAARSHVWSRDAVTSG
jgi:hypothetical protein